MIKNDIRTISDLVELKTRFFLKHSISKYRIVIGSTCTIIVLFLQNQK